MAISYRKRRWKKEQLRLVHELQGIGTAHAMQVSAEISASLDKLKIPRDWVRLAWYSDECGGRLVRFKAGCPYGRKRSKNATAPTTSTEHKSPEKTTEHDEKRLSASLSRTRRRIYEIAACNPWTWFFTGTLDGEKCDRNDLNATFKRLSQYIRDYRKQQEGEKIAYMIVPEQHKDGAWHFHGLLQGVSEKELHKFTLDEKIPQRIRKTIENGTDVFTWYGYQTRFGWATLTRVRSHEAVSKYITKYVTKELQNAAQGSGAHLYYASRGLKKPQILAEGTSINGQLPFCDFENEWVALRSVTEKKEARAIARTYLGVKLDFVHNE